MLGRPVIPSDRNVAAEYLQVASGRTAPSATSRLPFTPNSAISRYNETGGWSYPWGSGPRPSRCTTEPMRLKWHPGSNGNWMKEEAQVK